MGRGNPAHSLLQLENHPGSERNALTFARASHLMPRPRIGGKHRAGANQQHHSARSNLELIDTLPAIYHIEDAEARAPGHTKDRREKLVSRVVSMRANAVPGTSVALHACNVWSPCCEQRTAALMNQVRKLPHHYQTERKAFCQSRPDGEPVETGCGISKKPVRTRRQFRRPARAEFGFHKAPHERIPPSFNLLQ